jgi:CheY-like chemotaxis protein
MPEIQEAHIDAKSCGRGVERRGIREPAAPAVAFEGRVLIVDDGPENRHLLRIILGRLGLEVEAAENGVDACRMAEQSLAAGRPFSLILMDMQMPDLDGYDATRWLRRQGWSRPIVAVTAYALPGDREKCLAAGCDDYLPKPVDRRRLVETLGEYLGQSPPDRPPLRTGPTPLPPQRCLLDDPRINPADRERITNRFLDSLPGRVKRIQQALVAKDRDLLVAEVRAVGRAAALLGFAQLSEHARELERQARSNAAFHSLHAAAAPMLQSVLLAGHDEDA